MGRPTDAAGPLAGDPHRTSSEEENVMTEVTDKNKPVPESAAIRVPGTSDQPRAYWSQSRLFIVHVSGEETDERLSLVEGLLPPDAMTPLHVLPRVSQILYVLEGELTAYLPGMSRVLRRGDAMYQPIGVPQTHRVTSAVPARVLAISSPAGFERFFVETGRPAESMTLPPPEESPPDLELLAALAAEHGLELLGPPGTLPSDGAASASE
jgi:quercetin dioxygenase-like cupin family protein